MEPIKAILIGAGARGAGVYAPYALRQPGEIQFVAVAEPDPRKRQTFAEQHGIPLENAAANYEALLERPPFADAVLVCTQDKIHTQPALMALQGGYHVLLEKPMATTETECRALAAAADKSKGALMICHVLRFTAFFSALKGLLQSGRLGRVVTVQHTEQIANWHFAHSYVRGSWRSSGEASPMILAKCCHDLDLLHWLVGSKCTRLSSEGGLAYFTSQNAPAGAPARCTDGCPARRACPYYTPAQYLTEDTQWPTSVISPDTSYAAREDAMRRGLYGRCVFRCDNDVCDHQTLQLLFENGVTASFTASAFTKKMNRLTAITGTNGELRGDFEAGTITYHTFDDGQAHTIQTTAGRDVLGHGGGDDALMRAFLAAARGEGDGESMVQDALQSHLWAFAAEKSRAEGAVVYPG